jgi:hypothetical protein
MPLKDNLYLGITGHDPDDLISKIEDLDRLEIDTAGLFLELLTKTQREEVYEAISKSSLNEFPLVHIRNDMNKDEVKMLVENYNATYLTIHEEGFKYLDKWHGFYKKLFLEMNYDNSIITKVDVDRIGGFCVDLSHFKAAEEDWTKEFNYILEKRNKKRLFKCNHLSGFSFEKNTDLHDPISLKAFDYVATLPDFVFGDVIAIEIMNSIPEQIGIIEYVKELL